MCLGESGSAFDEAVDIRRVNSFVTEAADRVETLIVCENHENVWFTHTLVPTCSCRLNFFGQFPIGRDGIFATRADELMNHEILDFLFLPLI